MKQVRHKEKTNRPCIVVHRRPPHHQLSMFGHGSPSIIITVALSAQVWHRYPFTLFSQAMLFAVCIATFPLPEPPTAFTPPTERPPEPMLWCMHRHVIVRVPDHPMKVAAGGIKHPNPPHEQNVPRRLGFFSRSPLLSYGPPARLVPQPKYLSWRRWQ